MIPTKILVYRGPDGGTHSETVSNTRRRKKSTGELFQKGYRVRMGHGHVGEKEDQDSIWYSLGACFHVISYWGKTCRNVGTKGNLHLSWMLACPEAFGAGSGSGFALYYAPHLANAHSKWETSFGEAHHISHHFIKDYLFIFVPAEWLPVTSLICVIWHSNESIPGGKFVCSIKARMMDFTWLLTLGWGGFQPTLRWIFFFKLSWIYESFSFQVGGSF